MIPPENRQPASPADECDSITVIGGGLSGAEAAWQAARLGLRVHLFEMRPVTRTPAHQTDRLAEIVCSNSLKSDQPYNASWLLKEELRRTGSLLLRIAGEERVPAGGALAVDRDRFARAVTEAIEGEPRITLHREEVREIPSGTVVVASGPLTSPDLSASIRRLTGQEHLYFYDAISPIVDAAELRRIIRSGLVDQSELPNVPAATPPTAEALAAGAGPVRRRNTRRALGG
jgi:methylenetetrahydrofolate--tRNA-(uracil-5-)-methyltransferase